MARRPTQTSSVAIQADPREFQDASAVWFETNARLLEDWFNWQGTFWQSWLDVQTEWVRQWQSQFSQFPVWVGGGMRGAEQLA